MKHALSSLDSERALAAAAPPAKRRRIHFRRKPALQPLLLTREALSTLQASPSENTASINRWASSCIHSEGMDPNQAHPRLLAQTLRRAKARSRTPSPVKKSFYCATPEYRNGTMKLALVFVERDPELPAHIAAHVERILGTDATRNAGEKEGHEDTTRHALVAALAETYRAKCRSLAGDCTGEGEWRSSIYSVLMDPLSRLWSPALKLSASEKPWSRHLKPSVPQWNTLITRPLQSTVFLPPVSTHLPAFPTPTATLSQDDPSSSSAASVTASDSSVDDKLQLSTPKPDVTVGLASDAIKNALGLLQDILLSLQTDPNNPQPFVSDPHQVPLGLRFPFLIVEAKGLNTGGNLIHAQNQAAVAAASALNMLNDLDARAALVPNINVDPKISNPIIVFSVATEGPTHELWVHYQSGNEYHMSCLRSWRTTLPGHAELFVRSLERIMGWGAGRFKDDVVERVGALWGAMCAIEEMG